MSGNFFAGKKSDISCRKEIRAGKLFVEKEGKALNKKGVNRETGRNKFLLNGRSIKNSNAEGERETLPLL